MATLSVPMVGGDKNELEIDLYTNISQDYENNAIRTNTTFHKIKKNIFKRIKGGVFSANGALWTPTEFIIIGISNEIETVVYRRPISVDYGFSAVLELDLDISKYNSILFKLILRTNVSYLKVENIVLI